MGLGYPTARPAAPGDPGGEQSQDLRGANPPWEPPRARGLLPPLGLAPHPTALQGQEAPSSSSGAAGNVTGDGQMLPKMLFWDRLPSHGGFLLPGAAVEFLGSGRGRRFILLQPSSSSSSSSSHTLLSHYSFNFQGKQCCPKAELRGFLWHLVLGGTGNCCWDWFNGICWELGDHGIPAGLMGMGDHGIPAGLVGSAGSWGCPGSAGAQQDLGLSVLKHWDLKMHFFWEGNCGSESDPEGCAGSQAGMGLGLVWDWFGNDDPSQGPSVCVLSSPVYFTPSCLPWGWN